MNERIFLIVELILTALVLVLLGVMSWNRRSTGKAAVFLAICLWSVAIYSFGYGMELSSSTQNSIFFWVRFEHWGIQLIAPTWLLFAMSVSGYEKKIKPSRIMLLAIIPLYLFLTSQTLGWLNWGHVNPRIDYGGAFPTFVYDRSVWNYIAAGFYLLCLAFSTGLFTISLFRSVATFRRNAVVYLLGSLPPLVGQLLQNFALLPSNIDYTPFMLSISGLLFVYGFTKLRLLDIIPLARDTIFENMNTGVMILDREDRIVDYNPAMQIIFPTFDKKVIGKTIYKTFPDDPSLLELVRGVTSGRIELKYGEGIATSYYRVSMSSMQDKKGQLIGKIINFYEFTMEKDLLDELVNQAAHDGLTGIYNRQYFMKLADKEIQRHNRYGGDLSLIMMDLDHFKQVNDTYGHAAGDLVLRTVADIFSKMIRQSDIFARIGGEEFIMLLPETKLESAQVLAERLRNTLDNTLIEYEGQQFYAHASFGISGEGPDEKCSLDDLYRVADQALYRAKSMGGASVCVNTHNPFLMAEA
ncbi:MAG: diguanylate cyclase [Anaerolineaceae bacterium]|nr:diguanylate cyclase [Anaerolineaceae bacterium]